MTIDVAECESSPTNRFNLVEARREIRLYLTVNVKSPFVIDSAPSADFMAFG
ncbi:MAG: hypothetical protein ABJC89_15335 [Acidobacteriota bacterium]